MHILLADNHALVRDSIASFIQRETGVPVATAPDVLTAANMVHRHGPYDLVLLEYALPGMQRLTGLATVLQAQHGRPAALISSAVPVSMIGQALRMGAAGYIPKSIGTSAMMAAIRAMARGERFVPQDMALALTSGQPLAAFQTLTAREASVLRHVCRGMTNVEIGKILGMCEATVKSNVKSICTKVAARNRTQASMIATEAGFV
jgi:DNA-binding NarL/FixJ family response regulator